MPSEEHLEMIQGVITRLAGNSFQMKAWNIALATAAIGFAAAKDSHPVAALFAAIPSVMLWTLDGYYLALEKSFRDLYEVAISPEAEPYHLTPDPLTARAWLAGAFRPSVWLLHAPLVAVILGVGSCP